MKKLLAISVLSSLLFLSFRNPAPTPSETFRKIHDAALTQGQCYFWLKSLCKGVGARLSGSPQAEKAVEWGYNTLRELDLDRVEKQEVMVPHWVRGTKETAQWRQGKAHGDYRITALGGSIGTPSRGITAPVLEVHSLDEVAKLDPAQVKGKIVFYNRPMDPKLIDTFHSYGGCVDQRAQGAVEASKMGAVAVIVRSMTLLEDPHPHTGAMRYQEGVTKIPAAAMATEDAAALSAALKNGPVQMTLRLDCQEFPDVLSHNVIGEIKGSRFPEEIITIGGHLDSWDKGEGAHDDGAGCVQSMEVLHLFKLLGIQPQRTVRCVLFMNEENGMRGGLKYAEVAKAKGETHIAALESDRGGFTPRGFTIDGDSLHIQYLQTFKPLFAPYKLHEIVAGYGGVDISPLKAMGTVLIGFMPDSQRYFDYHHADTDNFEAVNRRELELGAAAMACLVWMISEEGIPNWKPK